MSRIIAIGVCTIALFVTSVAPASAQQDKTVRQAQKRPNELGKQRTRQPKKVRQKQGPSKYTLVIPLEIQESGFDTETRAQVRRLTNNPQVLFFLLEPPNYKAEQGPMGMFGGPSLSWASGAEHVYMEDLVSTDEYVHFKAEFGGIRLLPDRRMVMIASQGTLGESNQLGDWRFESDASYPLTFKVVKGIGYVYMCGRGQVVSPTSQVQKLGRLDTAEKWLAKLNHLDALIREAAAQALGWIGNRKAVPALIKALSDPNPLVHRSAAESLGKLGDPSALPALKTASEDEHKWTAETAKWARDRILATKQ